MKVDLKEFTSTILNEGKMRDQNTAMCGFKKTKLFALNHKHFSQRRQFILKYTKVYKRF